MRFLETIFCRDAQAYHLHYHQKRVNRVAKAFNFAKELDLSALISPPQSSEILRCRVLYDAKSADVSYHAYTPKEIQKFKVITLTDDFDYTFKYADRTYFNTLHQNYPEYDEFIFVKNGYITDCSIANLALYSDSLQKYISAKKPLLEGTTAQRLYDEGKLLFKDLTLKDLQKAKSLYLLNAMLGIYEVKNAIIH